MILFVYWLVYAIFYVYEDYLWDIYTCFTFPYVLYVFVIFLSCYIWNIDWLLIVLMWTVNARCGCMVGYNVWNRNNGKVGMDF